MPCSPSAGAGDAGSAIDAPPAHSAAASGSRVHPKHPSYQFGDSRWQPLLATQALTSSVRTSSRQTVTANPAGSRPGAGADFIDGRGGADDMDGGDGSDTYIVDHVNDTTEEESKTGSSGGVDTVKASVYLQPQRERWNNSCLLGPTTSTAPGTARTT